MKPKSDDCIKKFFSKSQLKPFERDQHHISNERTPIIMPEGTRSASRASVPSARYVICPHMYYFCQSCTKQFVYSNLRKDDVVVCGWCRSSDC